LVGRSVGLVDQRDPTDLSRLRFHQRAFITAALRGPDVHAGGDMRVAHAGLAITDADFDAVVGHLGATLAELGVPEATIGTIAGALAALRADVVSLEFAGGLP
jgi:hemoglobin